MSTLKFYETLKNILSEVEIFLTSTIKDVKVSKSVSSEKDRILKKLSDLQEEFPQLKVDNSHSDNAKNLPSPAIKQAIPKSTSFNEDQEIYDDIGNENLSEGQDSQKPPSSISEASEVSSDVNMPTTVSVKDAMSSCSHSGFLIRGSITKSKIDIKQLLGGIFGGKKFCVVGSGIFYMFDKANSKKQTVSFPLRGYEARACVDQLKSGTGAKAKEVFMFELVNPGQKSYVFVVDSQEELNKWLSALNMEALKVPDPRLSAICGDDDSINSDYEEPDVEPFKPSSKNYTSKPPASMPLSSQKLVSSGSAADNIEEELYDDIQAVADYRKEPEEELYEDTANTNKEFIDEIYEEFNDVAPAVRIDHKQPAGPSFNKLRPPAVPPPSEAVAPTPPPSFAVPAMGENEYENMFYGRWDCQADDDNELSFKRGDIVLILSREFDHFGWWVGKLDKAVGLVPREYMTPAYELVS